MAIKPRVSSNKALKKKREEEYEKQKKQQQSRSQNVGPDSAGNSYATEPKKSNSVVTSNTNNRQVNSAAKKNTSGAKVSDAGNSYARDLTASLNQARKVTNTNKGTPSNKSKQKKFGVDPTGNIGEQGDRYSKIVWNPNSKNQHQDVFSGTVFDYDDVVGMSSKQFRTYASLDQANRQLQEDIYNEALRKQRERQEAQREYNERLQRTRENSVNIAPEGNIGDRGDATSRNVWTPNTKVGSQDLFEERRYFNDPNTNPHSVEIGWRRDAIQKLMDEYAAGNISEEEYMKQYNRQQRELNNADAILRNSDQNREVIQNQLTGEYRETYNNLDIERIKNRGSVHDMINRAKTFDDYQESINRAYNYADDIQYSTGDFEKDQILEHAQNYLQNLRTADKGISEDYKGNAGFAEGNMTEDEFNTLLYLIGNNQWSTAKTYWENLEPLLNERYVNDYFAPMSQDFAAAHPLTVGLPTYLGSGYANIVGNVANMSAALSGNQLVDSNSGFFAANALRDSAQKGISGDVAAVTGTVADTVYKAFGGKGEAARQLGENLGEQFTGVALSWLQSVVNGYAFAGGVSNAAGNLGAGKDAAETIGRAVSFAQFGATAASDATYSALQRGAGSSAAMAIGLVNGLTEMITESISLEAFDRAIKADPTFLKQTLNTIIGKAANTEGIQELTAEVIEQLADRWILQDTSQMETTKRQLMMGGMSEQEADSEILKGFFNDIAGAYAGGILMGGMGTIAGRAINSLASVTGATRNARQEAKWYLEKAEDGSFTHEDGLRHILQQEYEELRGVKDAEITAGTPEDVRNAIEGDRAIARAEAEKKLEEIKQMDSKQAQKTVSDILKKGIKKERELNKILSDEDKVERIIQEAEEEERAADDAYRWQEMMGGGTELNSALNRRTGKLNAAMRESITTESGNISNETASAIVEDRGALYELVGAERANEIAAMSEEDQVQAIQAEVSNRANAVTQTLEEAQKAEGKIISEETARSFAANKEAMAYVVGRERAEEIANMSEKEQISAVQEEVKSAVLSMRRQNNRAYMGERQIIRNREGLVDLAEKSFGRVGQEMVKKMYEDGENPAEFYRSFKAAYDAGIVGGNLRDVNISRLGGLSAEQIRMAYEAGKADQQELIEKHKEQAKNATVYGKEEAGLDYNDERVKKLSRSVRKHLDDAGKSLGVKIVLADYADNNINGDYTNGVITVYMGSGSNSMQWTFSHEATHRMKEVAPEAYYAYRKIAVRERAKNFSGGVGALVESYQNKYREYGGQNLTEEEAMDEIAADFTRDLFAESKYFSGLVDENLDAAKGIRNSVKSIVSKAKNFFSGDALKNKTPAVQEFMRTHEFTEDYNQIRKAVSSWDSLISAAQKAIKASDEKRGSGEEKQRYSIELGMTEEERYSELKDKDIRYSVDSISPAIARELNNVGIEETPEGTVARFSVESWENTDIKKKLKALVNAGHDEATAEKWIKDINSIASIILSDRERLDYVADRSRKYLKPNGDYYKKTLDSSTLCDKRRIYQGTYNAIQHMLPNTPLTEKDVIRLRELLLKHNEKAPCGICYVESQRKLLGKYAKEWYDGYGRKNEIQLADVTTSDGLKKLKETKPEIAAAFEKAMAAKGVQSPKVVQLRTDYREDLMTMTAATVNYLNSIGGLRFNSFSDFETPHLIDTMQAILDMSAKGLMGMAYSKVPAFAGVFGGTGIKINLSLIVETDENGNVVRDKDGRMKFSSVEGIDYEEAKKWRDMYPDNVAFILVGKDKEHVLEALNDDRVDFVIPFHRSKWTNADLERLGLVGYEDFATGHQENGVFVSEYWDYNKTGIENAEAYLELCALKGVKPVFEQLLVDNGDGSYSLQEDGSTDNYWKLLVEGKMYNHITGKGAPQQVVKPNFNMDEARRILDAYDGGADTLPVADAVVKEFVEEYKKEHSGQRYSVEQPFSARNINLKSDSKIKYVENKDYKNVTRGDSAALDTLRDKVKKLPRKDIKNRATGYFAKINSKTVNKILNPSQQFDEYGIRYLDNLNAAAVLPQLFENAVYLDSKGNQKQKNANKPLLNYHHFIAPLVMNGETYRVRIVAREAEHSDTLYIVEASVIKNQKGWQVPNVKNGNVIANLPVDISVSDLVNGVKIKNYTTGNYDVYSGNDLKFSIESPNDADMAALERENSRLRMRVDNLKEQTRLTKQKHVLGVHVNKVARQLIKSFDGTVDVQEIQPELQRLYDFMISGTYTDEGGKTQELTYENVRELSEDIARKIVDSAEVVEDDAYQTYAGLRQRMRSMKIHLTDDIAADVSADYNDFRKSQMGRLNMVRDSYSNVDSLYKDLMAEYPEFFDDLLSEGDQLRRIAEVADIIFERNTVNPYDQYYDQAINELANDIQDRFWDVPEAPPTLADKARTGAKESKRLAKFADRQQKSYERKLSRQAAENDARIERYKAALQRSRDARANDYRKMIEKNLSDRAKRAEIRDARELRGKIVRHAKELSTKLLRPNDKKHIPQELRNAVAKALSIIDLSSKIDKDTGKPRQTLKTTEWADLRDAYENIMNDANGSELVVDPIIVELIKEVESYDKPIANLDSRQLRNVWNLVRAIESSVSTAGKMLSDSRYQSIREFADELLEENRNKDIRRILKVGKSDKSDGKSLVMDVFDPYTYFHMLGKTGEHLYRKLRDAQDAQRLMREDLKRITEKIFTAKQVREWENAFDKITLSSGETLTLTKAQEMELYILAKREDARRHLLGDGIMQPTVSQAKVKRDGRFRRITEADLQTITGNLTPDMIRVADQMQAVMANQMADYGNKASMEVFGYEKFNDKTYWPMHVSSEGLRQDSEKGRKGEVAINVKNMGMAKAITLNASNALDIGSAFDSYFGHWSEMERYASYLSTIEDVNRIFNYRYRDEFGVATGRTVKELMEKAIGPGAGSYWLKLLDDLQNGLPDNQASTIERAAFGAVGNIRGAAVAGNIRVILQQPGAAVRALLVMNPGDMAKGMVKGVTAGNGWKKALKYSPIAMQKDAGGFDINKSMSVRQEALGAETGLEKMNDVLGKGAGIADAVTWGRIWNAAEWQVARTTDLQPGSEAFYKEVNRVFTNVIDQTQVVDGVLQRSQVMRSPSNISKQLTAFMGEPIKSLNMLYRATSDFHQAKGAQKITAAKVLTRAAGVLVLNDLVQAFIQSLVDAWRHDDRDKKYWERFLKEFTGITGEEESWTDVLRNVAFEGNLGDNLNYAGKLPYIKDVISMLRGYDVNRADMDVVNDIVNSAKNVSTALSGNNQKTINSTLYTLAANASKLFGISVPNVIRDVKGLILMGATETDNLALHYEMDKFEYDIRNKKNKTMFAKYLTDADKAGDTDLFNKIYNDLLDAGYTDKEIRKIMNDAQEDGSQWLNASEQREYDQTMDIFQSSGQWSSAGEETKSWAEDIALDRATQNEESVKLSDKIEEYIAITGNSETDFLLNQLAYQMAKEKQEEVKDDDGKKLLNGTGVYYDAIYDAYTSDSANYDQIYDNMIDAGFTNEQIKSGMENRMKEEQGVDSVYDLDHRWLNPTDQREYDVLEQNVSGTSTFNMFDEDGQNYVLNDLYDLVTENSTGQKLQDKIDEAAYYGVDSTEYLLAKLAHYALVSDYDENGNYTKQKKVKFQEWLNATNDIDEADKDYIWSLYYKGKRN